MAEMRRRRASLWAAFIVGLLCAHPCVADTFRRGDANVDSTVDTSDAVRILLVLFSQEIRPDCLDALDANDDGSVDVSDPVYVLLFLFDGGARPGPPYPDCGDDPSLDDLDCATYSECVECESVAEAEAAIAALIPRVACIPEDAARFEFDVIFLGELVIDVCPGSEAVACGAGTGCRVDITQVDVELDLTASVETVLFRVAGRAVDLPVTITTVATGEMDLCQADLPFNLDVGISLETADVGGGAIELVALREGLEFGDIVVDVDVSGVGLCSLANALKELVIGELTNQAEAIAGSLLEDANDAIVGRVICRE